MSILIAPEPKITVQVDLEGESIAKITLAHSTAFHCQIRGATPASKKTVDALISWLKSYAKKKHLPFNLPIETDSFKGKAQAYLQKIPFGEVVTYGEIAKILDNPRAARAVGNACGTNPFPLIVPCHRVIASDGSLGGFGFGLKMKKQLLDFEGATQFPS